MPKFNSYVPKIQQLAALEFNLDGRGAQDLLKAVRGAFREHLVSNGYSKSSLGPLTRKFTDAGRRSPPWEPTSSRVPGRPQDGADGNRRNRWLFPPTHKFYADEATATLVEVRFIGQTLAMQGAPKLPKNTIEESLNWLLDHPIEPGAYVDPIQVLPIELDNFVADPSSVQSGHLTPLDRGGRHEPANTFLMLKGSNALQGNLTVPELLTLLRHILESHEGKQQDQVEEEVSRLRQKKLI